MVLSRRAAVVATSKTTCNGITSVVYWYCSFGFFPKIDVFGLLLVKVVTEVKFAGEVVHIHPENAVFCWKL